MTKQLVLIVALLSCTACSYKATKAPVAPAPPFPNHSQVRIDDAITQPLIPPPTMPGMNAVFVDTRYNNIRILRATDPSLGAVAYQTADAGAARIWTADGSHLIVNSPGDKYKVIAFDKTAFRVSVTALELTSKPAAAWKDAQKIFELRGTEIHQLIVSADWKTAVDSLVFDFRTCLGQNFVATWTGSFEPKDDDQTFVIAFSNTGGQGSGHYLAAYRIGKTGCQVYDTTAGTITGWGLNGKTVDDGTKPLADRFTLHAGGGGAAPGYALVSASLHQPDGSSGCLAGNCLADAPYVWEIGTTHVRICGGYKCDGHGAQGKDEFMTGDRFTLHDYQDPAQPLTQLLGTNMFCSDFHGTWADGATIFAVATKVNPPNQVYPCAGYDEITGVDRSAPGVRKRYAQTLNSGNSKYFIVQNAIGVVAGPFSVTGIGTGVYYVAFTSDWEESIAGDVFIAEIR